MKKVFLIIALVIFMTACSSSNVAKKYKADYKQINKKDALKLVSKGNTVILDVRNELDYSKKHIKNSINIPYDEIDNIINEVSKDEIVIIYGSTKKQSKTASIKVINLGYSLVYDMGIYED